MASRAYFKWIRVLFGHLSNSLVRCLLALSLWTNHHRTTRITVPYNTEHTCILSWLIGIWFKKQWSLLSDGWHSHASLLPYYTNGLLYRTGIVVFPAKARADHRSDEVDLPAKWRLQQVCNLGSVDLTLFPCGYCTARLWDDLLSIGSFKCDRSAWIQ